MWKGGINTFDYSKEWNVIGNRIILSACCMHYYCDLIIIATGGKDSHLRLWNPYVSAKPTTLLKGHDTTIVHVAIVNLDGLIFSLSKDFVSYETECTCITCHYYNLWYIGVASVVYS